MTVRQIKDSWWVDFRFNHTRHRKRSPENSRAGALAYEASLRQTLARGETIDRAPHGMDQNQTFEQFAWKWFDEYVVPNNKYAEQRIKKYTLKSALVPFFGCMPVADISAYDIERYKARRTKDGLTNKTIKNHLTVLNKCLACAYEWLRLPKSPPAIHWPKCSPRQADYLSQGECEVLLSHADGIVHEMILMALRTGMRQGELKGLQWSSIDWGSRIVTVRHSRCDRARDIVSPKNNRIRHIPLDAQLHEVLYRRKKNAGYVFTNDRGKPFDHNRLSYWLERVCNKAGLRRITWHVLRHTFASHLALKGVPLNAVQALLGHSTITMTMRYAHLSPSTLRTAIDLLGVKSPNGNFGQPAGNALGELENRRAISAA